MTVEAKSREVKQCRHGQDGQKLKTPKASR